MSIAKFAQCPYCGGMIPLFAYLKHVQVCKLKHGKPEKPRSLLERLKFLNRLRGRHL